MHFLQVLFVLLSLITIVIAWPDGAPCIHAVYESMNPLEAVEHQGGLQLTVPPYHIEVRQKCYWINQPVEIILRGNTSMDRFRGFAMQPISYKGPNRGKRVGQFLRLDDNGSWQQQCFRFKDSVTHSHEEKKKQIKLWWKNELNDDDYVQFVATVVKAQKEFWVKSIKSIPVAPCRIERNGIQGYKPEPITPPPPANQFKLDTFRLFDAVDDELRQNMLETIPNDADPIRKPQRIQDFFKVMQISDRLNPKSAPFTADVDAIKPEVPQRTGISRRIRPPSVQNLPDLSQSQTDQQIPAVTSLAQQQLENDQITLAKHRSAERFIQTLPHDQFQQISNQVIQNNTIPTVLSGPQQPFPFTKRPQFQQAMMRRLINSGIVTKKTKTCINFDPLQTCMDRMNYCEISQYMKIRCRKACRFC